ncbi:MAG TPA: hypothetical protein VN999_06870 [Thermoanaerobaculia bacterium]|nr:hypothetical protein [Thermoanaerobaculia bacterium]
MKMSLCIAGLDRERVAGLLGREVVPPEAVQLATQEATGRSRIRTAEHGLAESRDRLLGPSQRGEGLSQEKPGIVTVGRQGNRLATRDDAVIETSDPGVRLGERMMDLRIGRVGGGRPGERLSLAVA